jgi:predicted Fe-Mo cluster-binding NifX family protein
LRRPKRSVECSDSEKKMSACADQNHAPSLTCVRLEYFVKLAEIVYNKFQVIQRREGIKLMKIAVTYENGMVFQHFGHSEQFKIYEVEDGKIIASEVVPTNGQGHGALAGFLTNQQVEVLICGGIGAGAQTALANVGIKLYGGVSGLADSAVSAYLAGKLDYNPDIMCSHHGEGHSCGEHNCGNH